VATYPTGPWARPTVDERGRFATLRKGEAALLQLAPAIEQIEADLWQQYNKLGGAVDHNDQPNPGNPTYIAALQNLDGDMPQYISDN
jgi:hypothetical protein